MANAIREAQAPVLAAVVLGTKREAGRLLAEVPRPRTERERRRGYKLLRRSWMTWG
jgi:hypothetical protein